MMTVPPNPVGTVDSVLMVLTTFHATVREPGECVVLGVLGVG